MCALITVLLYEIRWVIILAQDAVIIDRIKFALCIWNLSAVWVGGFFKWAMKLDQI